jgi:hypothetical protein
MQLWKLKKYIKVLKTFIVSIRGSRVLINLMILMITRKKWGKLVRERIMIIRNVKINIITNNLKLSLSLIQL